MHGRSWTLALATTLAVALPTSAAAAPVPGDVVRAVVANVPGATITKPEEPVVGVPAQEDVLAGRLAVVTDPEYWIGVVKDLVQDRTILLPSPVDLFKPEALLPTVPVADGPKASPLPRQDVDLLDVRYPWQGTTKTLRQYLHTTETDVVAFLHDGKVVADHYVNGWSSSVRHQPWSVTKSFVSALVGIALHEGKVGSLQDPIDRYVPELAGTAWAGTTIRNLLAMESGVHWDEGTPVLAVNTQVQQWIQAGLDLLTDGALGQTRNEFLKSLPRVAPQGTRFSYNSGNTQVLAWMLERVYGQPFNEVISEKLWAPAQMDGDAKVMTDRVGDAIASQGLYARVFDLARFGELFRHGGRTPDGTQVVPEAWVRESTTMTQNSEGRYALQWWRGALADTYDASGFQGQKISVTPSTCLTGVRLSHTLGLNLSEGLALESGEQQWWALYRAVAAKLGGCPPSATGAASARARRRLTLGRTAARMSRRAALRRGAVRVRVLAGQRVRGVLRLTARRGRREVLVARRQLTLPANRVQTVSLRLTRDGRRLLRDRRSVSLVLRATGGQLGSASRRVVLR
ncbi:serine hydrolase [Conexibacter sp. SYSU D00693]|uniref:serine hydrolase domain-containing protein n=1 Tax=Conexibacter sp. SYSU D00693 TaxID=2812560 RepID=UPI00196B09BB|nr:serine hydrolase domain-containing protein [Conexibacter sp. SYSU D00693]